jgi:hypothetical protein
MTNELSILLTGIAAAFSGGIGLMLLAGRPAPRVAAEPGLAELLHTDLDGPEQNASLSAECAALREALKTEQVRCLTAETRLAEQIAKLARSTGHEASLENQVAGYLQKYAIAKDVLRRELIQKNALMAEMAAANAQISALRSRIQELELRDTADRRRPTSIV